MALKDIVFRQALRLGFHLKRKVANYQVRATLARLMPVNTCFDLIRIGGKGDGGYLVPDDLDQITACFSPGVDTEASFEADLAARGIPCFLADASVPGPPVINPMFNFERKFLGVVNDETYVTLDNWVESKHPDAGDLILQMDIEGSEWAVLLNVSEKVLRTFRIIVLELHGLPHLFDPISHQILDTCLNRLCNFFHVVHAHPNNYFQIFRYGDIEIPYFLEVTLLRKDRAEAIGFASRFPHSLDSPNVPGKPDAILPSIFRGANAQ